MTTLVHEAGMWKRVYERGKLVGFAQGLVCGTLITVATAAFLFHQFF